jgi:hypothetical protein
MNMPWIQFIPLLTVVVLMFVAATRGFKMHQQAVTLTLLANSLLSAALTLSMLLPSVSNFESVHGLLILSGLLTGAGMFFLVLAFVRLAQPSVPRAPLESHAQHSDD